MKLYRQLLPEVPEKVVILETFFLNLFNLFIFGCAGPSLLRTGPLVRRAGATPRCSARASHCGGFSCCGAQAPGARTSAAVARGLSSCGLQAQ